MRAFIFPGQGSQFIGMGLELAQTFSSARDIFQEIDEVLSFNLFKLMTQGSAHDLQLTINAQPALFAVSAAILKVLRSDFDFDMYSHVHFLAGHSLGEYTAYYAGQSLSLSQTVAMLRERGKAMQEAVPNGVGGMIAVIGASLDQVVQLVEESCIHNISICEVANDNAPGQIIVSGHLDALERFKLNAASYGIKRILPLPVSAPFHCSLMKPAAKHMNNYLTNIVFDLPMISLLSNVTAQCVTSQTGINALLVEQITGRVRWRETIENLHTQKVTEIIEVGAGKVLSNLVQRITPDIKSLSISDSRSIDTWISSLN